MVDSEQLEPVQNALWAAFVSSVQAADLQASCCVTATVQSMRTCQRIHIMYTGRLHQNAKQVANPRLPTRWPGSTLGAVVLPALHAPLAWLTPPTFGHS